MNKKAHDACYYRFTSYDLYLCPPLQLHMIFGRDMFDDEVEYQVGWHPVSVLSYSDMQICSRKNADRYIVSIAMKKSSIYMY